MPTPCDRGSILAASSWTKPRRWETIAFLIVLGLLAGWPLGPALVGFKVASPSDWVLATAVFEGLAEPGAVLPYEPRNRLQTDPTLQFEPWVEFNRAALWQGWLPLWNDRVALGAPHWANAQSAVLDPFHLISYLGQPPFTFAWVLWARWMVSGWGMFLLADRWGLQRPGRWFAGLAYAFGGFTTLWLHHTVASSSAWLPWCLLAADRLVEHPSAQRSAVLALPLTFSCLGGHVQTTAHVWILTAAWGLFRASDRRGLRAGLAGFLLAIGLSAAVWLPLLAYLGRSPVWEDRAAERPWPLALVPPRWIEAIRFVDALALGSQRRGHPNLARPLGADNLNESAGGFAGMLTLMVLAPLGWAASRRVASNDSDHRRVRPGVAWSTIRPAWFALGVGVAGGLVALEVPPAINLVRAVPLLNAIDHRRLTLWCLFALAILGGLGWDAWCRRDPLPWSKRQAAWVGRMLLAGGVLVWVVAVGVALAGPSWERWIRADALAVNPRIEPAELEIRVARRLEAIQTFGIWHFFTTGCLALAGWWALRLRLQTPKAGTTLVWSAVVLGGAIGLDLARLVQGQHPLIDPDLARFEPWPPTLCRLRERLGEGGRVVGLGAELPPNLAMRFGLADLRNYDSIEQTAMLAFLEPLFEKTSGTNRTSRRDITWAGVERGWTRLEAAGVEALVADTPPPETIRPRLDAWEVVEPSASLGRRGRPVWIAWLRPPGPTVRPLDGRPPWRDRVTRLRSGHWRIEPDPCLFGPGLENSGPTQPAERRWFVRQTFDPGWKARDDQGRALPLEPCPPELGPCFVVVANRDETTAGPPCPRWIDVVYEPPEVAWGLAVAGATLLVTLGVLIRFHRSS